MTIDEFCETYHISRRRFYQLQEAGRGPEVAKQEGRVTRVVIPAEAARAWAAKHRQQLTQWELVDTFLGLARDALPLLIEQHGVDGGIRVFCRSLETLELAIFGTTGAALPPDAAPTAQ